MSFDYKRQLPQCQLHNLMIVPKSDSVLELKLIAEHIRDKSRGFEGQIEAVQKVRKLLCSKNINNTLIGNVIDSGMLPDLVQCLRENDSPMLQSECAWVLTNLAYGNSEHTLAITSAGAVPALADLLLSPDRRVCEQAVWALGNIVGDGGEPRLQVISQGIVERIISLVGPDTPEKFLRLISWVILNLCRNVPPLPPIETIAEIVPAVKELVQNSDLEVVLDSVWAVSLVAGSSYEKIQMLIDFGMVPLILPLLNNRDQRVVKVVLRAIGNIAVGSDEQTQVLLDNGLLGYLPEMLHHPVQKVNKEALWILSNITAGNRRQIQEVLDSHLMPSVFTHLRKNDALLQREATWVLRNLVVGGSHNQVSEVIRLGAVPLTFDVLKDSDSLDTTQLAWEILHLTVEAPGRQYILLYP